MTEKTLCKWMGNGDNMLRMTTPSKVNFNTSEVVGEWVAVTKSEAKNMLANDENCGATKEVLDYLNA